MVTVLLIAVGYGLGSIPTGLLIARWQKGVDIRQHGSGNIGMTNVLRAVGKGPAVLTLVGDLAKGLIPVLLAQAWLTSPWAIGLVVWAACVAFWLQVSLGSLLAATSLPVAALLWGSPAAYILYALLAAALIWYR